MVIFLDYMEVAMEVVKAAQFTFIVVGNRSYS